MSALPDLPTSPRRVREVITKSEAEIVRGASAEALAQPAGELLESLPWEGPAPDADSVAAAVFLGWL
jgi:hypothetical protein